MCKQCFSYNLIKISNYNSKGMISVDLNDHDITHPLILLYSIIFHLEKKKKSLLNTKKNL